MTTDNIEFSEYLVKDFVETVENANPIVIANYMTMIVLESHLRKLTKDKIIIGMDPISMQLIKEIMRINPTFNTSTAGRFKIIVTRYLLDNKYQDKYFESKPL
jgi:hypothetical protein